MCYPCSFTDSNNVGNCYKTFIVAILRFREPINRPLGPIADQVFNTYYASKFFWACQAILVPAFTFNA